MMSIREALPQKPGTYIWQIVDWGYLQIGAVKVNKDPKDHVEWLLRDRAEDKSVFVYMNEQGEILTMYHSANDVLPPMTEDKFPLVNRYTEYDEGEFIRGGPLLQQPNPVSSHLCWLALLLTVIGLLLWLSLV